MKTSSLKIILAVCFTGLLINSPAQTSSFTYQGRLNDANGPANGTFDLTFTLYDAEVDGTVIGGQVTNSALTVSSGLFTAPLDFGPVFNGTPRWLEIAVRTNGVGSFVTLSPRQFITPTPMALHAATATSVAGLIVQTNLTGGPNVILGSSGNSVSNSVVSATISGGAANTANGDASTIGGGNGNVADRLYSTVGGGSGNRANWDYATISGGQENLADNHFGSIGGGHGNIANGYAGTIGGGEENKATVHWTTIGGGQKNTASQLHATVGGGFTNTASGNFSTVSGGVGNSANSMAASVGGGEDNTAGLFSHVGGGRNNAATGYSSVVAGGSDNQATAAFAAVPGGVDNLASAEFSFAAGRRAKATHQGAFVWADSQDADFSSTSSNQFLIRAAGGVGIGTAQPGLALSLRGIGGASEWLSFRDTTNDVALWHLNGIGGGLNFVETSVADFRLYLAKGGNVGIGTNNPQSKLQVAGNILFGNNGNLSAVGNGTEKLRIVRGIINNAGAIVRGGGFTAARNAVGSYTITFSPAFSDLPTVTATGVGGLVRVGGILTAGSITVATSNFAGTSVDDSFSFIAIGPQ